MRPLGLFVAWRWENAFLATARSLAVQSRTPGKAGILQGRVADWLRCAAKTRGLEKGNAEEADFFFIWGDVGFRLCALYTKIMQIPHSQALPKFYVGFRLYCQTANRPLSEVDLPLKVSVGNPRNDFQSADADAQRAVMTCAYADLTRPEPSHLRAIGCCSR